jgi:hypothetical protein
MGEIYVPLSYANFPDVNYHLRQQFYINVTYPVLLTRDNVEDLCDLYCYNRGCFKQ